MKTRLCVALMSACIWIPGVAAGQTSNGAIAICTGLYHLGMYDTDSVLSAEQYFQQVQNMLQDTKLNQYSDLQNMEKNLGGSFSNLEDAIGLTDDAKTSSSVFQSELHNFLNSSFNTSTQKRYFQDNRSTIDQGLVNVMNTCINDYFNQIGVELGVVVTPGYSDFSVELIGKIPTYPPQQLMITGMTPINIVSCKLNGKPIPLNQYLDTTTVLLECTKDPKVSVNNLMLTTNAGNTSPISIPAINNSVAPHPISPPTPPQVIHAVWQSTASSFGTPVS